MRKPIEDFADAMEYKLSSLDAEKGTEGWRGSNCSVRQLKNALAEELRELEDAFDDCTPDALAWECVDVANFAMMIYDRIRQHAKES